MNIYNPYGIQSQASKDIDDVKALMRKKQAAALVCNRYTDVCSIIQCPHNKPHKFQQDCKYHQCSRDQRVIIVDCVVFDG